MWLSLLLGNVYDDEDDDDDNADGDGDVGANYISEDNKTIANYCNVYHLFIFTY